MRREPKIHSITIKGNRVRIYDAELATDSMQLPGFLALRVYIDEKPATRYISLSSIEEMTIADDELYKTVPGSFVPYETVKAKVER